MKTRRQFLLGGAATLVAAALPMPILAQSPIEFIGMDWGAQPSQSAAYLIQFVEEARREVVRITAIPMDEFYIRS